MKLYSSFVPYLLLVTFYSPAMNSFSLDKIGSINNSPYHGVAVQLVDSESTSCAVSNLTPALVRFNRTCKKDVWPWIFFNRFVGAERGSAKVPQSNQEHWFSIRGMDLYNEAGALEDFFCTWRNALQLARKLGSPGIVVDPEPYNNYEAYELSFVAGRISRPKEVIKDRLKEIGRQLADIAEEMYPEATIWFLFSGLGTPEWNPLPFQEKEYRTVAYILLGMLERAAEKRSKLRFVSGGEVSLGYCFQSIDDLNAKIARRAKNFAGFLDKYPNLTLGGTISPWQSVHTKKDWLLKNECGRSSLQTIDDFEPLFTRLLESYGHVWIYAAGAAGFDPYSASIASVYHGVLTNALRNATQRAKVE